MNIQDLIRRYSAEVDSARTKYDRARQDINSILEQAKSEGRSNLTAAEDSTCESMLETVDKAKVELRNAEESLAKAQAIQAEDDAYARQSQISIPTNAGMNARGRGQTATIRVGREPHTYRAQNERTRTNSGEDEPGYIADLYRMQVLGDPSASERIARHGQEMAVDNPKQVQRAVNTGGVPGFLPPQYLTELFALYARAGRPTANLVRKAQLPAEGMSVNIPRVTTSTKTGVQATENTTIANQDPASTLLTANVNTIGGYVVLSRQSVERGPLTEQIVVSDLAADYNAQLDSQVLNGSGSSGQHLGILNVAGINAVTYTAATPVLVGATTPMWPKLASAIGQVMSGRFAGPTAMVMSPTEWAWMLSTCDASTYRPIIQPNQQGGAFNPAGTLDGPPSYPGVAGWLFNLPVYLDGSMPSNLGVGTNQSALVVADFDDLVLFEDNGGAPSQLRFEQPSGNALGVMLVAYGYSAFAGGRQPKSISVVTGTGMITPAL